MKWFFLTLCLAVVVAVVAALWPKSEPKDVGRLRDRIERIDTVRAEVRRKYNVRRERYRAIADTTPDTPLEASADSVIASADSVIEKSDEAIVQRDSLIGMMIPRPNRIQGVVHPKFDPFAEKFVLGLGVQVNVRPNAAVTAEFELQKQYRVLVGVRMLF